MMPYYSIPTKSTTSPCLRWRRQVYLLLAHILGKLTAKPVDGSQGNRVPAPKSGVKVIPSLGHLSSCFLTFP